MKLSTPSFRGMAPRLTPRALPENGSQEAINAKLLTGDLEPWHRPALVEQLPPACTPPTFSISATPTSGEVPLTVQFTLTKAAGRDPITFLWDFGDGGSSTEQNPTHEYTEFGTFVASVTITNECGTQTLDETITVEPAFFATTIGLEGDSGPMLPPNVQAGAALVLIITRWSSDAINFDTPGWGTLISNSTDSGGGLRLAAYLRVATGTDDDENLLAYSTPGGESAWAVAAMNDLGDSRFPGSFSLNQDFTNSITGSPITPLGILKVSSVNNLAVVAAHSLSPAGACPLTAVPSGYTDAGYTSFVNSQGGAPLPGYVVQLMVGYKIFSGTSEQPGRFTDGDGGPSYGYGSGGYGAFMAGITFA
jgi:PKD repeat protein